MLLFLWATAGCKKVEAIPGDLDGVLHFLWQNLDEGADEDLVEGVANLDRALGGKTLAEATDGTLTRLAGPEVEPLGITDQDPADASGIFLGNLIQCGLPMVAEIVTAPDQELLYPGVYETYERTYDGDIDAFLANDTAELSWSLDYDASIIGSAYSGHTEAFLRRVVAVDEDEAPFEEAYLVRFFAPDPAEFEEGSGKTFEQDYQFEIYWSRAAGETLHAYAMWREANWGTGFTSEDESVQRLILNGMEDWDHDTEKICEDGGP